MTWQRCGVWRDSESLWQDAARQAPDHYTLRYLGMGQMGKGKYAEGEENLRRSIACSETQYGRHYLAEALRLQGRHAEAIRWYEKFLAKQDWYAPALTGYGLALMEIGEPARAAEAFKRCSLREPGQAAHKGRLGWALMDQGQTDEAELLFKEALAQDPQDITTSYNYAVLLGRRADYVRADGLYRQILKQEPEHLYALVNLGATLCSLDRNDEARAVLRRALEVNPHDKVAEDLLLSLPAKPNAQ
jgi:tetratricopeptide (TPR) repeat protein